MKPENHTNTRIVDVVKGDVLHRNPLCQTYIVLPPIVDEEPLVEVTSTKKNITFCHPVHYGNFNPFIHRCNNLLLGLIVLEDSKVQFTKFHHQFITKTLRPGSFELLG